MVNSQIPIIADSSNSFKPGRTLGRQDGSGIHSPLAYRSMSTARCRYCKAKPGHYCTMPNGTMRSRVHQARIDSWKNSRMDGEWVAELLVGNSEIDLHPGDLVLLRAGYQKGTVEILRRLSDGHDPEASVAPESTRFLRESTASERRVTGKRTLSRGAIEDREIVALYQRTYARTIGSMASARQALCR